MPQIQTEFPHKVEVIEALWVPLPDGTRLAAKLWLPETALTGTTPVPVLLEYLPYRLRDGTRTRDQGLHMYVAGHGYACIRLDIRGTGESDGVITGEYTEQEQLDGVAAIEWLAQQPWCDGQVSMIGISWGGFNGLQIAARQPPALKSIITVGSTDDRYATDIHWVGGCLSKDNFDWSATMFSGNDLPPDPQVVGEAWRAMWMDRIHANQPWIIEWLHHQRRDDYWKQGSICEDFSAVTIPVYAISGWADNYSEAVPRLLANLSGPRLGLVGPWAHSYPHEVTVEPAIGWLQELVRWLDHWTKGIDTGMMDQPMYRVWMQEHVPPQTCYLERPGRWVAEESWPSPRIQPERMALGANGVLGGTGDGIAQICSPLWVGLTAGEVGRYGNDADWPTDQREDDGGSLVFITAPLTETKEILGAAQLHLSFSSDKPQALVAVRLNNVAPDGRSTRVAVGLLNLTHRDSHEHAIALTPGQSHTATVDLDDIAHAFPPGHRIAVSISTTYYPIAWPSPDLATLNIHLGESWLDLPVRPSRPEDASLPAFAPPIRAPQTPHTYHPVENPPLRRVSRDLLSGKMTVDFPRWTYSKTMPDIGQTQTATGIISHEIIDGDPLSAVTTTDYRVTMQFPQTTIHHHSTGRMSCTATHFRVEQTLKIHEAETLIFERQWDEEIARDMV
ncbi:MAG: CocE/NonD family hydrolase [Cypionkella sp.]|uniref:CocE/NonD family hydrolase n=1 Tax=Cypionkella sp. TaxID=2811411 RepID=UPI002AB814C0|nr:CocE/NonD family hydrolase [Cypionkella sp.]MDZ4312836.1 CocE/NonD family hydrolase [Cypionkella sp.]